MNGIVGVKELCSLRPQRINVGFLIRIFKINAVNTQCSSVLPRRSALVGPDHSANKLPLGLKGFESDREIMQNA
jgi:hypothetical protein